MTDPTGLVFLSYPRTRAREAQLLIEALKDRGVPTWQDVLDLEAGPTEENVRQTLLDPSLSGAIVWITPEARDSKFIRRIEVPLLLRRARGDDRFFLMAVAAGGLSRREAAAAIKTETELDDLRRWLVETANGDPIEPSEAARIARLALQTRVRTIHRTLQPDEPIRVRLDSWSPSPRLSGTALSVDWSRSFERRFAASELWSNRFQPALADIKQSIFTEAPRRRVVAEGQCTLSCALALGRAFPETAGIQISWMQRGQEWHLDQAAQCCDDFQISLGAGDPSGDSVAVMLGINQPVRNTVARSERRLPQFRARLQVEPGADLVNDHALTPAQASSLAQAVIRSLRSARREYPELRTVHLFLAVPAGLAMLLGQLLNTFPVQMYEHEERDNLYRPSVLLEGSAD